ncbi:microtubule binding motor protein [Lithospermum erythrorhizon]|uniref:Microtubule binding motor protein n=1 Tax=Lithospermum erythrorhizon TaxID=34254 RepID=A0AAV3QZZ6_LITER
MALERIVEDDLQLQRETVLRRYEAGAWLRKMVGVVVGKDLPAQPSEDDFRLGLRSGIILCKVLNKVKPQSVAKVVEAPADSILIPDGEALSAYKYFENVRNFLVSVKEMGLPTFETSDLEKGGKSCRIVNCVLALKSYKEAGGSLSGKVGENQKVTSSSKQFARKITDLFSSSLSRSPSLSREMSTGSLASEDFSSGGAGLVRSPSLSAIVHELLVDMEQEDMRDILENSLSKVMEEFEHRLALQKEQVEQEHRLAIQKEHVEQEHRLALLKEQMEQAITQQKERQMVNESTSRNEEATSREGESCNSKEDIQKTQLKCQSVKQQMLADRHKKDIQELKSVLNATKTDMHLLKTTYEEEVSNLGKHLNGLTDAASGYKKVIEENRKLYNLVQDLKGSIRVYCRVRPFLHVDAGGVNSVDRLDDESITVIEPSKNGKDKSKSFTFNKVFGPSATQEEVFADTQPLVRSVLDGYNVCIFAYGQTGSGKTHTMSGPNDLTKETMGVNYRALNDLFHISEQRKHLSAYDISVQMIEIYNEQVRDLLVTDGTNKRYPFQCSILGVTLEIHNNSPNGINVPDANIVSVSSPSDVINLMSLGHNNRAVGSTAMNDRSSRSHRYRFA